MYIYIHTHLFIHSFIHSFTHSLFLSACLLACLPGRLPACVCLFACIVACLLVGCCFMYPTDLCPRILACVGRVGLGITRPCPGEHMTQVESPFLIRKLPNGSRLLLPQGIFCLLWQRRFSPSRRFLCRPRLQRAGYGGCSWCALSEVRT